MLVRAVKGLLPEKYLVVSDGATVTAYNQFGGVVASGPDGGAVMAAVLPAAGSAGGLIEFRNDGNLFPWGSVPGLPNGITGKLHIRGNGVTVQLSAGGPRFLDFNRTADYNTFQHIEVTDFVVDCNSIDAATHTIIGNRTGGVTPAQRSNFLDITVRRIRAFNIPSTATSRSGITIDVKQPAGGEGTLNYWKDILFEDVQIDGGITGIAMGSNSGATTNYNILYDNIRLIRCKHTEPTAAPKVVNGACFQIGQNAPGGYLLIRDCYGEYSKDVGVEVDNATEADIEDCVMSNCSTGYLTTNFAPPNQPNAQSVTYRRCKAVVTDAAVAAVNRGWNLIVNNAITFGSLTLDGCVFHQSNNVFAAAGSGPWLLSYLSALTSRRVTIRDCQFNVEAINWNNASATTIDVIGQQGGTIGLLEIKGLDVRVNGSISGAGAVQGTVYRQNGGTVAVAIDGINLDWSVTGVGAAGQTYALFFSSGVLTRGTIRGVNIIAQGSDTNSKGIRFGATGSLTITHGPVLIEKCDFAAMSGTTEFQVDATQSALGAILAQNNIWKTKPVPVALTGLVTATGKALGAAGALWNALVQLTQGSGVAVTAVDYSTNGGTTYTNLLTQASGALPAGAGPNVGPLAPADLVRAAFTTTQPTITLVPVDP